LTFEEIQKSGAEQNPGRFVASGWCTTVGIVGWSIGGGHGPFARSTGLGVDNILEVELVLANSSLVVANATHNSDLFWALKGGGGSTWGVITAITVQAHRTPNGGFSRFEAKWESPYCTDAQKKELYDKGHDLQGIEEQIELKRRRTEGHGHGHCGSGHCG